MQIQFLFGLLITVIIVGVMAILLNGDNQQISIPEWLIVSVLGTVMFMLGWHLFTSGNYTDTEFLNGKIAEKGAVDVSCKHCRTVCDSYDDKGNCTSSHTTCDHDHDIYFFARTDYYQYFPTEGEIDYGTFAPNSSPPADWQAVTVGDPATTLHRYINWLRGAGKLSLLFPYSPQTELLAKQGLFPNRTFEYFDGKYYAPKAFLVDGKVSIIDDASRRLMELNSIIGTEKQGNLQMFFVHDQTMEYANAYMDFHKGGGKNDVNVFVGLDGDKITWVAVRYGLPGFDQTDESNGGSNTLLEEIIRQDIQSEQTLAKAGGYVGVSELAYRAVMDHFDRVPNKQFGYLKDVQRPTDGQLTILYVATGFLAVLLGAVALETNYLEA